MTPKVPPDNQRADEEVKFPSLRNLLEKDLSEEDIPDVISDVVRHIRGVSFKRWYRMKEFTENIRDGQSYFNGPSSPPPPLRHSPSQLLQCHRKIYYRQHNAPKETTEPVGIFWIGEHVETDLIVPYFQAVADDDVYVQNSIWVDFTVESRTGDLHLKGETDPVFVDANGKPFLLTEIKTKESVENLDSPNDHHLAQAHAYMYGLTQKYDRRFTDVLIVYADRSTLELKVFHHEFDPVFWRSRVLDWAASHSEFRIEDQLPSPDPEYGWECQFCSYRKRCGKETDGDNEDSPPRGLLPLHEYPEEVVVSHLEAYSDTGVKLTPTVAHQHPHLASKFDVYDWVCESCDKQFPWKRFEPTQSCDPLPCPHCGTCKDSPASVRGPTLEEQGARG